MFNFPWKKFLSLDDKISNYSERGGQRWNLKFCRDSNIDLLIFLELVRKYNLSIIVVGMQKITDLSGVILIMVYTLFDSHPRFYPFPCDVYLLEFFNSLNDMIHLYIYLDWSSFDLNFIPNK